MTSAYPAAAVRAPRHATADAARKEIKAVRFVTLSLALLFVFGVLTPVLASFDRSFLRINRRLHVSAVKTPSPYGLCADLCATDGTCRHVIVPDGWHHGQRISDDALAAAASCH